MVADPAEQSAPLSGRRSRDRLEVLLPSNVGVSAVLSVVEVKEGPRPEVEGGMDLALVTQAVDLPESGLQVLVRADGAAG
jgi:hypothetical protein